MNRIVNTIIQPYSLIFLLVSFVSISVMGAGNSAAKDATGLSLSCQITLPLFKVDTGGGILPLHNFTLSVTLKENTVFLKWVAENEMNTDKFVVQRSTNGTTYKDISDIPPAGPINMLTEYNSVDDATGITNPVAYYRIKAEDNRGNFAFSNVVPVRFSKGDGFSCWPNPFTTILNLSYNATTSTSVRLEIYDNGGRQVISQLFTVNRGVNQLSVNGAAGLASGLYHVRITDLLTQVKSFARVAK